LKFLKDPFHEKPKPKIQAMITLTLIYFGRKLLLKWKKQKLFHLKAQD